MPVTIRPFAPSDYDAALALWRATPGIGLSDADERAAIERYLARNAGLSFVAIDRGEIVGTVLCGHDGRRGYLHHLACASSHRRRGIGRQLLRAGLAALAGEGIGKCHLFVLRANSEGLAFWRAMTATERVDLAMFSFATGTTLE